MWRYYAMLFDIDSVAVCCFRMQILSTSEPSLCMLCTLGNTKLMLIIYASWHLKATLRWIADMMDSNIFKLGSTKLLLLIQRKI